MRKLLALLLIACLLPLAASAETASEYSRIEIGTTSPDVKAIQERLIALGYLRGEADGTYWTQTNRAMMAFQQRNFLVVADRYIDTESQEVLFSEDAAPAAEIVCKVGQTSDDIALMQQRLYEWGFSSSAVDGVYGNGTASAVAAFQNTIWSRIWNERHEEDGIPYADSHFTVDGKSVDSDTFQYFIDNSYEIYYSDLQLGDKGPDVGRIQNQLYAFGYLWRKPDNAYDYFVQAAVTAFQKANGLTVTGIADAETQKLLSADDVVLCEKAAMPYRLIIDVDNQRVRAYAWDGEGYNSLVRDMVCSTGTPENPTPVGIFTNTYPLNDWHWFRMYRCWAQYSFVIQGGVMFHSILYYNRVNEETGANEHGGPDKASIDNLGTRASHGCIRLSVEDAKWIFYNCPRGTEVEVVQLFPDPATGVTTQLEEMP